MYSLPNLDNNEPFVYLEPLWTLSPPLDILVGYGSRHCSWARTDSQHGINTLTVRHRTFVVSWSWLELQQSRATICFVQCSRVMLCCLLRLFTKQCSAVQIVVSNAAALLYKVVQCCAGKSKAVICGDLRCIRVQCIAVRCSAP